MNMFKNTDPGHQQVRKFLEIKLGTDLYALELSQVKEVIPMTKITPIAGASAHVLGLVDLRGTVLTLIDVRKKFGIKPTEDTFENGIVIFSLGGKLVGMVIDAIGDVINVPASIISPVPESDKSNQCLNGIIRRETGLSLWLNPVLMFEGLVVEKNIKAAPVAA